MNLYIIRHGESKWNIENRLQGSSNPGLSKLGRLQAGLLAKRFKKIKIDRLYASPLLRSLETAQALSRTLHLKIVKKTDLREITLGEWEDRTPQEIDKLYNNKYQKWLRCGPTKVRIPGQERISSFRRRVDRAFNDIISRERHRENVLVVTHGGVISSFLARLLKADFDRLILKLYLPNTCVTLVSFAKRGQFSKRELSPNRGCLIHIADTFHLSSIKARGIWPAK
jgi:probable phosphoglycerate mutase